MSLRFHGSWTNFKFVKTGAEIKVRADSKVLELRKKQEERQERIRSICSTKGLDITKLLTNLDSFQRRMSSSDTFNMNVGEMEQLTAESEALKAEKSTLEQLDVMARNLIPTEIYQLTFEQLEYLGF